MHIDTQLRAAHAWGLGCPSFFPSVTVNVSVSRKLRRIYHMHSYEACRVYENFMSYDEFHLLNPNPDLDSDTGICLLHLRIRIRIRESGEPASTLVSPESGNFKE